MGKSSNSVDYNMTADPEGFVKGMQVAMGAAQQASDSINAQFKRVGDTFTTLNKSVMGFVSVLAAGGALKTFIADANDWNSTAAKMAKQLDISTEKASVLNVALNHIGVDSETYTAAAGKLSKQIFSNAQAFDVLGVAVRDASGHYRPITQVMGEVNAKLAAIRNPIEQNIAGQQVYGKSWDEVRGILKLTAGVMESAEIRARELGLIVGPDGAAMSRQYAEQMRDLGLVGKSLEIQFGNQLVPVFTQIGSLMSKDLPVASSTFAKGLTVVMQSVLILGANVKFVFEGIGREIGAVAAQLSLTPKEALSGGWTAISDAVKADGVRARAELDAFEKKVMSVGSSLAALRPEAGAGRGNINPPTPKGADPHYQFKDNDKKGKQDQVPSFMAYYEEALAHEKALATERDALHGMSKEEEFNYWQNLLQNARLSSTDQVAILKKASEARIAVLREEAQQANQLGELNLAAWQARQLAQVQREEDQAQQRVQQGLMTDSQLLQQQVEFENRRLEIQRTAIQASLAAVDPTRDLVQVAQLNNQLEQLEAEHQRRIAQIRGQIALQSANQQKKVWDDLSGRMSSLWDQGVNAMMNGTLRWSQAVRAVGTQLTGWFFNSVVKPRVTQWLFGEQAQTGATLAGTAARTTAEAAASQQSIAMWAMTAVKNIMTNAWAAMAAAWQAMVGIPYVGPVLAVAAAAAAFAGVSALARNVASAEGGYDIPAGVNPMTQLHEREMVLPARHADVIRTMADNKSFGGHAGAPAVFAPKITPLKGGFFVAHIDDMTAALRGARRDGAKF